jgi:hypothetical protein
VITVLFVLAAVLIVVGFTLLHVGAGLVAAGAICGLIAWLLGED